MSFTQTRRRFLTGLSLTGAAGVLRAPSALAAQPGLETPAVRIADLPGICIAPQYVAEELLHAEGFTDVRYVRLAPGHNTPEGIASGEVDFGVNFASVLVTGLDRGVELTVLGGVHVGCFELFVNEESRSLIELKGADHAYDAAIVYMLGTGLGVAFAALVKFAVLPQVVTYFGFSIILGFYLVPTGALIAQPRHPALFTAMAANFVPLLAPTNEMNYDTQQFYNSALAIVAGLTAATLSFRLIPPLSPASRSRRLLALTLRDLRRLATGPIPRTPADWEGHMYGRLSAMPDRAEPLQRAQLLAALSVGTKIIQLRRITQQLNLQSELDAALESIVRGDSAAAVSRLAALDKTLATRPGAAALRARGRILAMSEALSQHAVYFDAEGFR